MSSRVQGCWEVPPMKMPLPSVPWQSVLKHFCGFAKHMDAGMGGLFMVVLSDLQ